MLPDLREPFWDEARNFEVGDVILHLLNGANPEFDETYCPCMIISIDADHYGGNPAIRIDVIAKDGQISRGRYFLENNVAKILRR